MNGGYEGEKLKQARIQAGVSVKEMSELLISKGLKATPNTIYSWENGNSQPTPDALLCMCAKYCISDPLVFFGYEKSPAPAKPEAGEAFKKRAVSFYNELVRMGYLAEGEDFTDAQIRIVADVLDILDAVFPKRTVPESNKTREVG